MTDAEILAVYQRLAERVNELQLPFPTTPHPVWSEFLPIEELAKWMPFSDEEKPQWEPALRKLSEFLVHRNTRIELAKIDPLRAGVDAADFKHWAKADELLAKTRALLVLGGWRSSKTYYGARTVQKWMERIKGCRALCMSESYTASVEVQQRAMYEYLPLEFRDVKKTKSLNTAYTAKNGFSEGKFSLTGGKSCLFMNYTDDIRKVQGMKFHIVWCDENVTFDWLETLPGRLIDFGGPLLVTVTPIFGRTPTINWFLNGARVREWQDVKFMAGKRGPAEFNSPEGKMPFVLDSGQKDASIVCFATENNKFLPASEVSRMADGVAAPVVMLRLYGWPESQAVAQFPKFDVKVHGITADRVPADATRYMACDPHGSRNAFMLWMAVDRYGRKFIYREWPTKDMGEWALPGDKPDGKPGPAQYANSGRGINDYKRIILTLEGADFRDGWNAAPNLEKCEHIFERVGDARAINVTGVRKEDCDEVSFASLMNEELISHDGGKLLLPSLTFIAATGHRENNREIDPDVDVINSWLDYNTEKRIEPLTNEPQLYIVADACPNLIYAMQTWTGKDGNKGATKDPIDVLRMFAKGNVQYVG